MNNRPVMYALLVSLLAARGAGADGQYVEVSFPPSTEAGELAFGVTYTLWIPQDVARLRGIIVHQHGCGAGACKGGETAAYDLHWQALAAKWECGLLGPSYQQEDAQNCRLWCDPRNGSEKRFLQGLEQLAAKSGHGEVTSVPWCLWGHSGGAFWSSLMQTLHPERIVAIWFRSGTAYAVWEKGEIARPEIPAAAYGIPAMLNPGAKEKDHERFSGAWTAATAMFGAYRSAGALIGLAPDPRTAHECGDSRYLAIPFFDACLAMRLPDKGSDANKGSEGQQLKPVDAKQAWLATPLGDKAEPREAYQGDANKAVWLPNERVAKAWEEYVKTGATSDATPPAAPRQLRATAKEGTVELTWDAAGDLESGLAAFVVLRDGKEIGRVPEKGEGKFGRPLFQGLSFHDTPEKPLPEMYFVDRTPAGAAPEYQVIAVNSVGLRSEPAGTKEK